MGGEKGYVPLALEEASQDPEPLARSSSAPLDRPSGGLASALASVVEKRRTLAACLIMVLAALANDVALAWIHDRVPRDSPPLPDLAFDFLPEIPEAIRFAEWIVTLLMAFCLLLALFHQHRWIVIRRMVTVAAVSYFGRAVAITLLQVPVPSRSTYCAPQLAEASASLVAGRVLRIFAAFGMELAYPRVLCGDLVVSGHTIALCLAWQALRLYLPPRLAGLSRLVGWLVGAAVLGILLARKHYTLDVVLGYWLTTRVSWIYHGLVERRGDGDCAERSALSSVLWFPLFRWMEADAPPPRLFRNRLLFPPAIKPYLPTAFH